jgi:hypothetical protein
MLLCVLLFAIMDALVKLAAEHHPTGQIIFFRNTFGFVPLYFFIRRVGGLRCCARGMSASMSSAPSPAWPAWRQPSSPSP